MTDQTTQSQEQVKATDKELNFRALEQKYQKALDLEREARLQAERQVQEAQSRKSSHDDDEDDNEPYVDKKKLNKTLQKFGEQTQKQTQSDIQRAVHVALEEERQQNWLKNNPDFYDVMNHAEKFAKKDPELAETILRMPEGFERQKLVYRNIKSMGLDKPEPKQQSIQEKVDANRKSPYYQPTGMPSAPYATTSQGDFSDAGQKNAYDNMQKLKKQLRI